MQTLTSNWNLVTDFNQINRPDVTVLWDGSNPVAYRVPTLNGMAKVINEIAESAARHSVAAELTRNATILRK